ncbi:MAG: glutaredoxin 3 [Bdellovibrionales bacterium]|nr:glutaredoxin 3 [Bdellovibrionales bacterium]
MTKVKIYSKTTCPACVMAKDLLDKKGVKYEEIILDNKPTETQELMSKTGMRTVPQIFINGELIGGCSDLMDLDKQNKLDPLLQV